MSKGASKGVTEPCPELRASGLNSLSPATAKEKPGDVFRSGSLVLWAPCGAHPSRPRPWRKSTLQEVGWHSPQRRKACFELKQTKTTTK